MKIIYVLVVALLLCGTATAAWVATDVAETRRSEGPPAGSCYSTSMEDLRPYTISVIVWGGDGNRAVNTAVTFAYGGQSETLYSAEDGSVSFSLLNFDDVPNGAYIDVSSKYGAKSVPVDYVYGATGVTFNEPSEEAAIEAWAALGFVAVAAGGGIYYLTRKKKDGDE